MDFNFEDFLKDLYTKQNPKPESEQATILKEWLNRITATIKYKQ